MKFFIDVIKLTPEEMTVRFTFAPPDSSLSSFLIVPGARSDTKRRQTEIVYTEKIKEALVAGR